ncbi:conserved membrane hypothetical protein [Vibrio nigripulchritudo FTn2]|uniref:hypothetical protein n=1 Tax=Vibrio nigripulchritudo TaxID=28173 RepID=UPI0003B1B567|nr:hypothetical protein [Vibrio nigripulchritudo]CCN39720.1 conserved membrane hypothetical protein [Vibrio nigripulchritudo FTn2]
MTTVKTFSKWYISLAVLISMPVSARGYSLGSGGTGIFAKFTKFMQDVVDFLGGPGVMALAFIGILAAVAIFIVKPKEGAAAAGWLGRVALGCIILFSVGTVVSWVQTF